MRSKEDELTFGREYLIAKVNKEVQWSTSKSTMMPHGYGGQTSVFSVANLGTI
jgi:hypothetical protein